MRICKFTVALMLTGSLSALASEPVTVVSWGGTYEAAQDQALFKPYQSATGRAVNILSYNGNLNQIEGRGQIEGWQVIDMTEDQAIRACDRGLLRPIDAAELVQETEHADFVDEAFRRCSVAQNLYATVIAFDERAFPGIKPTRMDDFFDLERFPGKRGIRASPDAILEWALISEGVPVGQVYDLLSTDRGLGLALRKLEALRGNIVWWTDVGEPERLLAEGEVTMSTGYNGRLFNAIHEKALPLTLIWDGQIVAKEVWAIPESATDVDGAIDFIRFALQADAMARLAEHIPYSPTRRSALERIGLHPETRVPMLFHLPATEGRSGRVLFSDSLWYAKTAALRERRFEKWRKR